MKQREALQAIIGNNEKLDDENTVKRNYNYFIVERKDDDTIKSFTLNEKKIASAKKICGFHTLITLMLDMTPMEASENYALRDELEKCHRQMKSTQGCNRQNYWSEEGKTRAPAHPLCQSDTQFVRKVHMEVNRTEGEVLLIFGHP